MDYYKDAPDLNIYKEDKKDNKGSRKSSDAYSRLFINVGKADKVGSGDLIGLINTKMKGTTINIGKIELLRNFSFIEVDKEYEQESYNFV